MGTFPSPTCFPVSHIFILHQKVAFSEKLSIGYILVLGREGRYWYLDKFGVLLTIVEVIQRLHGLLRGSFCFVLLAHQAMVCPVSYDQIYIYHEIYLHMLGSIVPSFRIIFPDNSMTVPHSPYYTSFPEV